MSEIVTESTLAEYESFIQAHPKGHFMQSVLWAKQKPMWKWEAIISRDGSGKIAGSLAALIRRVPGTPFALMYGCRGPVCDIHDERVLSDLISGAKLLAKRNRAYALKLDPDVPSSDEEFAGIMGRLGFKINDGGKNFEGIQPRFVFRLNVEGKTKEELMAAFHSKTRYNLRVAEKKGVVISLEGREAVPEFSKLMLDTGVRDGFVTRNAGYFEAMLDNLGEHARLYMARVEGRAIAGTLAIQYGDKVWYLYGASSNEDRNLMPNYLLQWRMIEWSVETKCKIYDFRGVSGDLTEDNPLYGLYKFKKGFGGDFTEFIGELDCVFNPFVDFAVRHGGDLFRALRTRLYMLKNKGTDSK